MPEEDRSHLFDDWASTYDSSVASTGEFPFDGYVRILTKLSGCSSFPRECAFSSLGRARAI
jgi:hypothetical protein